jgi:endonuclease YncB( thermonuclease family)
VNKNYASPYLYEQYKAKKNRVGLWSQDEKDIVYPKAD